MSRYLATFFIVLLLPLTQTGCIWQSFEITGDEVSADVEVYEADLPQTDTGVYEGSTAFVFQEDDPFSGLVVGIIEVMLSSLEALVGYDPLVIQVPSTLQSLTGTFRCEIPEQGDQQGDLIIVGPLNSIPVRPGADLLPESGQRFFIIDFPDSISLPQSGSGPGAKCNFVIENFTPSRPESFKAALTFKVKANDQTYYAPTFPCLPDGGTLESLPAITSDLSNRYEYALALASYQCPEPVVFDYQGDSPIDPTDPIDPIPALAPIGLALLILGLGGTAAWRLRSRRR